MTDSDKLKVKIIEEFMSFEEKTNIQFGEDTDFPKEIISAESLTELMDIRSDLNYNACLALLESCKEIIDYYSKLFTDTSVITAYNDELSDYVEKIDIIDDRKGSEMSSIRYKEIFDKLWVFNKKLKQNKNNLVKQSKWKFWTKIYPIWFSIISIFYVAIIVLLVDKGIINFSYYLILGWFILLILVWWIVRLILYPLQSPFNVKKSKRKK